MVIALSELDITGKRLFIREDLNVPMCNGHITNEVRLQAALPTLRYALDKGAAVIVASHLGRPTEGEFDSSLSLAPVADRLSECLQCPVPLITSLDKPTLPKPGDIALLENVRFNVGEKENDLELAKRYAALCDVFVMDAFATAHRAQASTEGIAHVVSEKCAGPLLLQEVQALKNALEEPERPLLAVVGGAKISSKLVLLTNLVEKVDHLIVGGGIANTFIAAAGYSVGRSLIEKELIDVAADLIKNADVPIPSDVVVATELDKSAKATIRSVDAIEDDEMVLDIGPNTARMYSKRIQQAQTIVWNGPVGAYEWPQFAVGTKAVAEAIAHSHAYSIAAGGDTLAAIEQFKIQDHISLISTGGGAFLTMLEGKPLVAMVSLKR